MNNMQSEDSLKLSSKSTFILSILFRIFRLEIFNVEPKVPVNEDSTFN